MAALWSAARTLADPRIRTAVTVLAVAYLAVRWSLLLTSDDPIRAADSYTYWSTPYADPYAGPQLGLPGAYLYPPPFIQVLAPLRLLPWEVFDGLWLALGLFALVYMVGPIGAALAVSFLPFVYRDLLVGNVHLMLGAAIVLGTRLPANWAFPILTKLTPGIGLVWFAARREWRRLAVALGVTAAVTVVSLALTPDLWLAWIDRMRGDTGTAGGPYMAIFLARVVAGVAIVAYAGWRGRAWLIPLAVVISLPILWPDSLAILLACFPLLANQSRARSPRT